MYKGKYFIGLDMGTDSGGWGVTNNRYNILRAKGKDLWGIRKFDEASVAAERRTNRISRRRRQREIARMGLLKEYFADAVNAVDPNFFARLENSKYYLEDKDEAVRDTNALFNDPDFKDKNYYEKYPTIFHLRKALINDEADSHDVRFVYLALLNMFKHRGHFLDKAALTDTDETDMLKLYNSLSENIACAEINVIGDEILNLCLPECNDKDSLQDILTERDISRKARKEKLAALLGISSKQKQLSEILNGMCGLKIKLSVLFGESIVDDEGKSIDIGFTDGNAEEILMKLADILSDDRYEVLLSLREIYSNASVQSVLKGERYLSEARIRDYNKHKHDLSVLKRLLKSESSNDYNAMFRSEEAGSYSAYVNSCNTAKVNLKNGNEPKRRGIKERSQESFYAYAKKMIKDYPDSEDKTYVLNEIDKETFMPKQLTASNGVIPNQVHAREMKKILENAEGFLPFLKEKDKSGLTVSERLLQLFSFTIPYYVGPVSEKIGQDGYKGTGWAVRKNSGRVLPWNLSEKIDIGETRSEFINRLVRDCTYISGAKVLPKSSLLYEKYCVLNEINNIKIAGEKLDIKTKQGIYTDLFEKGKKVKRKAIDEYLISCGIIAADDTDKISGIDIAINSSLSSYGKMKAIFGEHLKEDKYRDIAEGIIKLCTIYGDDKSELKKLLAEHYASDNVPDMNVLTEKDINRIAGYKFSDWGRISKEFLELSGANKETGEIMSLINALWETNDNLMELLSDRYTYIDELKVKRSSFGKSLTEIAFDDLDGMYFSAPVKRMVWQTLKVLKEIEKVMGYAPDKIFVEMARQEDKEKKRTVSRAKAFTELYKDIKDSDRDWLKFIEATDKDGRIRSKKMYLYLTQMGRCMYSGREINLDEIMTDKYDIDHIYPRSIVKDDNIANNLVLVEKSINNKKQDKYPINADIRHNMIDMWKGLLEKKLITKEKYDRLTDSSPLTEEQLAGFIERQLVETRQGTKSVANILQEIMPDTHIVFVKAGNVSDFRRDNDLLKSRIVNDMHHAHDAYLNIVVGNVYDTKFTSNARNFIKDYEKDKEAYKYHLGKMFDRDVKRGGYTAWIADNKDGTVENATIKTVKKTLSKPSPMLTRMSYEGHGGIADQTLYSKNAAIKSPDAYIPLKSSDERLNDVTKYGGFSSASTAYFTLAEYSKKGKKIRSLEAVPIYLKDKIDKDEEVLLKFLREKTKDNDVRVRYKKILIKSLIKLNGYYMYITGKTGDRLVVRNAVQMVLNQKTVNYIKKLENESSAEINEEANIKLYDELIAKYSNKIFSRRPNPIVDKLKDGRDRFINLSIEEQKKVLLSILSTTSIGGSGADLKLIGASSNTGITLTNKVISGNLEFKLIQQSVTGIFECEIDLLTVSQKK